MATAIASVGCNIKHILLNSVKKYKFHKSDYAGNIERIEINETRMRSRRDRLCMVVQQTNCNIGCRLALKINNLV